MSFIVSLCFTDALSLSAQDDIWYHFAFNAEIFAYFDITSMKNSTAIIILFIAIWEMPPFMATSPLIFLDYIYILMYYSYMK